MATLESGPLRVKDRRDDFPIFIHSELDDYGLNPVEFRVYARLARRAGQHGKHSESIPNMAQEFDVSIRTIQYAVKVLISCRLITRHSRPGKTDEYSLNARRLWRHKTELRSARQSLTSSSGAAREGTRSGAARDSGAAREGGVVQPEIGVVVQPEIDEGTPSEGTPIKEKKQTPLPPCLFVFEHWKQVMDKPQSVCDDKRRRAIKARLVDYSVDDLKLAIDGCRVSAFHMGENDRHTPYNDIELICRNSTKVEFFMGLAVQEPNDGTTKNLRTIRDSLAAMGGLRAKTRGDHYQVEGDLFSPAAGRERPQLGSGSLGGNSVPVNSRSGTG